MIKSQISRADQTSQRISPHSLCRNREVRSPCISCEENCSIGQQTVNSEYQVQRHPNNGVKEQTSPNFRGKISGKT